MPTQSTNVPIDMQRRYLAAGALLAMTVVIGCFNPNFDQPGSFSCGNDSECPDGFKCRDTIILVGTESRPGKACVKPCPDGSGCPEGLTCSPIGSEGNFCQFTSLSFDASAADQGIKAEGGRTDTTPAGVCQVTPPEVVVEGLYRNNPLAVPHRFDAAIRDNELYVSYARSSEPTANNDFGIARRAVDAAAWQLDHFFSSAAGSEHSAVAVRADGEPLLIFQEFVDNQRQRLMLSAGDVNGPGDAALELRPPRAHNGQFIDAVVDNNRLIVVHQTDDKIGGHTQPYAQVLVVEARPGEPPRVSGSPMPIPVDEPNQGRANSYGVFNQLTVGGSADKRRFSVAMMSIQPLAAKIYAGSFNVGSAGGVIDSARRVGTALPPTLLNPGLSLAGGEEDGLPLLAFVQGSRSEFTINIGRLPTPTGEALRPGGQSLTSARLPAMAVRPNSKNVGIAFQDGNTVRFALGNSDTREFDSSIDLPSSDNAVQIISLARSDTPADEAVFEVFYSKLMLPTPAVVIQHHTVRCPVK